MGVRTIIVSFICAAILTSCAREKGSGSDSARDGRPAVRTGILILGSHNKSTLAARVALGHELYSSPLSFDYIIVSGGCGAHGSSFCEASEMTRQLTMMGVPPDKIFKEENSKSTVQNYCFSRELKANDGTPVIQKGDSLYVVSNHWHAIPVAARFSTYDSVHAVYYIKGDILPSAKDKTDYTNIYDNGLNSELFCE